MRVFFDTSGLFAVLVNNDCMHVRARATFECLVDMDAEFCITSYVLLETLALLQARVGLAAARRFNHEFLPILHVHWVDEKLHDQGFRRLELRGKRQLSLVDCTSFVWMEAEGISQALAYDEHFVEEGFAVLGTPDDVTGEDSGRWVKTLKKKDKKRKKT